VNEIEKLKGLGDAAKPNSKISTMFGLTLKTASQR
jgi:hypothetical protein